jgi:hypothetical protein
MSDGGGKPQLKACDLKPPSVKATAGDVGSGHG